MRKTEKQIRGCCLGICTRSQFFLSDGDWSRGRKCYCGLLIVEKTRIITRYDSLWTSSAFKQTTFNLEWVFLDFSLALWYRQCLLWHLFVFSLLNQLLSGLQKINAWLLYLEFQSIFFLSQNYIWRICVLFWNAQQIST